jgi:hypothetical protein
MALIHSSLRVYAAGLLPKSLALATLLSPGQAHAQNPTSRSAQPPSRPAVQTRPTLTTITVPTSQEPSSKGNHPADTVIGSWPHLPTGTTTGGGPRPGSYSPAGSPIGTTPSPGPSSRPDTGPVPSRTSLLENLDKNGPQVPAAFDMSRFEVTGLVSPNWPIVLDFMVGSAGSVRLEIKAADGHRLVATLTNTPNRRAYAIFRVPANFGTEMQAAIFAVHTVPLVGATKAAPSLRAYGIGAGEKAVGSVAIDQLTFQPATIHPLAREVAKYGFHAHSAFDGEIAGFTLATLDHGDVRVEMDGEATLSPIPQGERASGIWEGSGRPGEHMLQIRAWRGLRNGGDWVVAWSPDIVDVVK